MEPRPLLYPTFAQELLDARSALDVAGAVGLAIRADRHRRRLSQRAYAALRGWSPSRVSRLEAGAGCLKLQDVVEALEGTAFALEVCHARPRQDGGPGVSSAAAAGGDPTAAHGDPDPRAAGGDPTAAHRDPNPDPRARDPAPRTGDPDPDQGAADPAPRTGDPDRHRDDDPDDDPTPGAAALPVPVAPEEWPRTELIARVRDGSRRFPAHHCTEQVGYPPGWWWNSEATRIGSRAPYWYAPRWCLDDDEPRSA